MKAIELKDITIQKPLPTAILHESGMVLHETGQTISLENIAVMKKCGIHLVLVLEPGDDAVQIRQEKFTRALPLDSVRTGDVCPVTLYDSERKAIIEMGTAIDEQRIKELEDAGVETLYFDRDEQELNLFQLHKYRSLCESEMITSVAEVQAIEKKEDSTKNEAAPEPDFVSAAATELFAYEFPKNQFFLNSSVEISAANLRQLFKNQKIITPGIFGTPVKPHIRESLGPRSESHKEKYMEAYSRWVERVDALYYDLKSNKPMQFSTIQTFAKEICEFYADDAWALLNLTNMHYEIDNSLYIPCHCVNVCILSIGIAVNAGYSAPQVLEIAIGALMHDIGHVSTPRALIGKRKLPSGDAQKYYQHAIFGLSLIKNFDVNLHSTAFIIYQHHEYQNGEGLVARCRGEDIHEYAKIVALANEFDNWRCVKPPFSALTIIVKMVKNGNFDIASARSLIQTVAKYPLGCFVLVAGDYLCKVIGVDKTETSQPLLKVIYQIKSKKIIPINRKIIIDSMLRNDFPIKKEIYHIALMKDIFQGF